LASCWRMARGNKNALMLSGAGEKSIKLIDLGFGEQTAQACANTWFSDLDRAVMLVRYLA
jgi:hypothetical protein